jgi:hypothetical protein
MLWTIIGGTDSAATPMLWPSEGGIPTPNQGERDRRRVPDSLGWVFTVHMLLLLQ